MCLSCSNWGNRVNAQGQLTNAEDIVAQKFSFDQEERHRLFWEYIREKDWKSAATFIDKRAIAYYNNEPVFRRFRIMNLLVELFDECTWLVLYNPMKFKAGVTKSVMICDIPNDDNNGELDDPVVEDSSNQLREDNFSDPRGTNKDVDDTLLEYHQVDPSMAQDVEQKIVTSHLEENPSDVPSQGYEGVDVISDDGKDLEKQNNLDAYYSGSKFRPTAKAQKLPFAMFVDSFEGKEFQKWVQETTEREVARMIYAESNEMIIAKELGVSNLSRKIIQSIRGELKNLHCLQNADYDEVIQAISNMVFPKFPEDDSTKFSFGWSKGLECIDKLNIDSSMIKSGKFGPEVDDFTMPLPLNFPTKAGQAKFALFDPLARYEESLKKLKVESLPTTLDDVHEPTIKERLNKWYHKMNKTDQKQFELELTKLIRVEATFRKVESSTYIAIRRKTYFQLPGLSRHYPNPNYPAPAVIPRNVDFKRGDICKTTFIDKLFGKEVLKSNVVPLVGRKPSQREMFTIQNRVYRMGGSTYSFENYSSPKLNFEVDVLDNLVKNDKAVIAPTAASKLV